MAHWPLNKLIQRAGGAFPKRAMLVVAKPSESAQMIASFCSSLSVPNTSLNEPRVGFHREQPFPATGLFRLSRQLTMSFSHTQVPRRGLLVDAN